MGSLIDVLARMAALIALGAAWRVAQPGGLSGDHVRQALTAVVYYLLLPAMIVRILWSVALDLDSVRIAVTAAAVVVFGGGLGWLAARALALGPTRTGALLLAAAFPNAVYMGLPALDAALGPVGQAIAIQFDYFACTPLLLTVGVLLAQEYGARGRGEALTGDTPLRRLGRVPPFWAALAGVALNLGGLPLPNLLDGLLGTLSAGVVPLMLLSLGMSLSLTTLDRQTLTATTPVLVIQLALQPLLALAIAEGIGLTGAPRIGTVLEAAMPSMVLGIVLCDRYGLDSRFYSLNVTVSTLLSLLTLPLWLMVLTD